MSLSSTNVRSLENCIELCIGYLNRVIKIVWSIFECVLS